MHIKKYLLIKSKQFIRLTQTAVYRFYCFQFSYEALFFLRWLKYLQKELLFILQNPTFIACVV